MNDEARGTGARSQQTLTLEQMKARIGAEVGVSRWLRVDQARIDRFAEATDDHQFIHVDPERTRAETPFDGTIAHGFLTLSLLSKMAQEVLPKLADLWFGVNYGFDRVRFLRPVPVNSDVRGRFVLTEIRDDKAGEVTLKYAVTIELRDSAKPVLVADWIARLYLRDGTG